MYSLLYTVNQPALDIEEVEVGFKASTQTIKQMVETQSKQVEFHAVVLGTTRHATRGARVHLENDRGSSENFVDSAMRPVVGPEEWYARFNGFTSATTER